MGTDVLSKSVRVGPGLLDENGPAAQSTGVLSKSVRVGPGLLDENGTYYYESGQIRVLVACNLSRAGVDEKRPYQMNGSLLNR
jgi:hypothetical protein